MLYPTSYKDIKTGRSSLNDWLNKNYPKFYEFILNNYPDQDIKESLYMFYNDIKTKPLCKSCGKPVKFHGYNKGYSEFCCPKCAQNNKEVRQKLKNTNIERYGENYIGKFTSKGIKTKIKRYGSSSYNNKDKYKQTCLERYGVDNPMKSHEIQKKSKQTCLEKYGNELYLLSEDYNSKRKECLTKSKQTCLERYGVGSAIQSEEVKCKLRQTCLERYGVEYNCLRKEAHNSRNSNSNPNNNFKKLLNESNIKYTCEKYLNGKSYDFLVGNILIEINPYSTHNINWNPYGGKIMDKYYHFNKSKLAKENGYKIINIWDWDESEKIVHSLCNKIKIYARECVIKIISPKDLKLFLEKYHFQNHCKNQKIRLGLYYNDDLVQIMTFGNPRYNKKYDYELLRLCSKFEYYIIGGAEKLFKYFINNYKPETIISYCDNSKFTGNVYEKLNFKLFSYGEPSRHWYNNKAKIHITDNLLRQRGFDQLFNTKYGKGVNNDELMRSHNFVEIYDAGQSVWLWRANNC